MTRLVPKFGHILTAVGTVVLGACEVQGENDDNQSQFSNPEAPTETANPVAAEPTDQSIQTALLETDSAPKSYALEWSTNAKACESTLIELNKAHAQRSQTDQTSGDLNYAAAQAANFLTTDRNVFWNAETIPMAQSSETEVAEFDYFNDGINRRVVRMRSSLAGNKIVSLGVLDAGNGTLYPLSFGHAGIMSEGLPDTENLHSKLTYSVADVINLDQGYYTFLMPLEDFDPSGRIYLASWAAKDGTETPRSASDYYATLACVFLPADAAAASSTK